MERLPFFLIAFLLLAVAESCMPRRRHTLSRARRWPGAILLATGGFIVARLVVPGGLMQVSAWAETRAFGIFNQFDSPVWLLAVAGILMLDFAVWAQHVAMHKIGFLWRLHRVHHSDPDFDVSTALRFHPGELLISLVWKSAVVALLGLPVWLVIAFEIILSTSALFNHCNWKLPSSLDRILRLAIVTPDMHRVHHSTYPIESNRNFGFFLPWWDRMAGLYKAAPDHGHRRMKIGETGLSAPEEQTVMMLLGQPWRKV